LVIRNPKDFWSGVLFLAIGAAAVVLARAYPMGSALKMGPAYFPTVLGALLALIGVITIARGLLRPGEAIGRLAWREIMLTLVSTVLFGVLVRGAGLLAAIGVLVLVSAYASIKFRWLHALGLAAAAGAFCALLFVKALGLPIRIIGPWLGG
jgi:putative tricarboxylic transport membrane protein